jgi:hypothetical protein
MPRSPYAGRVRKRFLPVVSMAALTVASAFLAVAGEPIGFIGLVFFGGGGAVYVYLNRPIRDRRVSVRHRTLAGAGQHTSRPVGVVYPASRGFAVAVTLGSAAFVVTGRGRRRR